MSNLDGFRADVSDKDASRWGSRLSKVALVVIILGAVSTAVVWVFSAQVGALILAAVFTVTVGVLTIRQAILAERR